VQRLRLQRMMASSSPSILVPIHYIVPVHPRPRRCTWRIGVRRDGFIHRLIACAMALLLQLSSPRDCAIQPEAVRESEEGAAEAETEDEMESEAATERPRR
jgi:hypothetical protein